MPVSFLLQGTEGVLIDKGDVTELPADAVIGDTFLKDKMFYILRKDGYVAFPTDDSLSGFMSKSEIMAMLDDLDEAMTKNASELSIQERNTVIEMVNSAIEQSESTTISQVQALIDTALASLPTALTVEQVQAIVNESVQNVSGVSPQPDYAKREIVLSNTVNPEFFPTAAGTQGQTYTITKAGWYAFVGSVQFTAVGADHITNLFVNSTQVYRTRGTDSILSFDTGLMWFEDGDVLYILTQDECTRAHGLYLAYFPSRRGTNTPTTAELSTFATNTAMMLGDDLNAETIDTHKTTDRFRWQDAYDGERDSIIRDAQGEGLMADTAHEVTVPAPAGDQVINDGSGGVVGVTMENTDATFCTVSINGVEKYSSDGLTAGIPITKYFWVKNGDVINCVNATTFSYLPFITDPNSTISVLKQQVYKNETDLADLKASVEGKILDSVNTVDIEASQPYTVTATLGGRVHYVGLNVLITTWALTVNDIAVRNGNLLGLGTTPGDYDVKNGDIVDSMGMTEITFTPYVAGSTS